MDFSGKSSRGSVGYWAAVALAVLILMAVCGAITWYTIRFFTQYNDISAPLSEPKTISALPAAVSTNLEWRTFSNGESVRDIAFGHGFWWIATDGGLVVVDPEKDEYSHITTDHGLPGNQLRSIVVDQEGVIWIGTNSRGLVRYDGRRWTTISPDDMLPGSSVSRLVIDRDGHLWGIIDRQIVRYDGQSWRTIRFSILDIFPPAVNDLAAGRNGLWVATESGVWRFDGESWEQFTIRDGLINDRVEHIAIGRDGTVWAATPAGVGRWSAGSWGRITVRDGLYDLPVRAIAAQPDGTAWFGYGGGTSDLAFYDGAVSHQPLPEGTADLDLEVQVLRRDGVDLWVGTSDGLWLEVESGWLKIDLPGNVPHPVTGFVEADTGEWVASPAGIYQLADGVWSRRNDFAAAALALRGDELVAAGRTPSAGLLHLSIDSDGERLQRCTNAGPLTKYITAGATAPNGSVWFVGERGAMGYDGAGWRYFADGWPPESVARALAIDSRNRLWAALEEGLFRLDPAVGRWQRVLSEEMFRIAIDSQDKVWFLSNNGLAHLVEGRPVYIPYPPLKRPTLGFEVTEDGLWISGEGGIGRFNDAGWQIYTMADGLLSDDVMTLAVDREGSIYAGFSGARQGFSRFKDGRWSTIHNIVDRSAENGGHTGSQVPRRDEVWAMGVTAGERVWFGTQFGQVGSVAPNQLLYQPNDFKLVWSNVKVIVVDDADSVWVAGQDGRMARYWPLEDRWERYDGNLSQAVITAVVATDEGEWVGTNRGVVAFEGDRCEFLDFRESLNVVAGSQDRNSGLIWWATNNAGSVALDPQSDNLSWAVLQLRGRSLIDLTADRRGRLWFLSNNDLVRLTDDRVEVIDDAIATDSPNASSLAILPDGQPLLGGETGASLLGRSGWEPVPYINELPDPNIYRIEVTSGGDVWYFSAGGISVYRSVQANQ